DRGPRIVSGVDHPGGAHHRPGRDQRRAEESSPPTHVMSPCPPGPSAARARRDTRAGPRVVPTITGTGEQGRSCGSGLVVTDAEGGRAGAVPPRLLLQVVDDLLGVAL